jgi:pimeloyl-ACP methyl ester carboxylesterase
MKLHHLIFSGILILSGFFSCTKKGDDEFVHLGGQKQYTRDLGEGEPVVVFITGLGDDLSLYDTIQKAIAKYTKTISYDRGGIGSSEPLNNPRSVNYLALELNEILENKNTTAPIILVGHSMGGHIARYFAKMYPQKVAGLVLIDPSHELYTKKLREARDEHDNKIIDSLIKVYASDPRMSVEYQYIDVNDSIMSDIKLRSDIPITLFTSSRFMGEEKEWPLKAADKEIWVELHKRWAEDYSQIKHIITERSGHYIYLEEPDLVINEINSMIIAIRSDLR